MYYVNRGSQIDLESVVLRLSITRERERDKRVRDREIS